MLSKVTGFFSLVFPVLFSILSCDSSVISPPKETEMNNNVLLEIIHKQVWNLRVVCSIAHPVAIVSNLIFIFIERPTTKFNIIFYVKSRVSVVRNRRQELGAVSKYIARVRYFRAQRYDHRAIDFQQPVV